MTLDELHGAAYRNNVKLSCDENYFLFYVEISVAGKKGNRENFISEANNLKPIGLHVNFEEYRFLFMFKLKKLIKVKLKNIYRKVVKT